MADLKMSSGVKAIAVMALALAAAGWWQWHERKAMDEAGEARFGPTPEETRPAPVITPDTVNPTLARHIYPAVWTAREDIAAALKEAKASGKRVIVDFGGDWCPDCQVLDIYFHQSPNREILERGFVKVNVNIGQMDQNIDVAAQYGVPIAKGVPALAVLDGDGKVLYAQRTGEFNSMARMQADTVTEFLNQWKPRGA